MARPSSKQPTPAELEVLHILWDRGPASVREVLEAQGGDRAYTSVMSLLNVMTDKGLLRRRPQGRAFVYSARAKKEKTLGRLVGDLWGRAFAGSTSQLVAQLLEQANPDEHELAEIRRTIEAYGQSEESP
jgi:predicted transcriptional regulator